jgi:hypothetical protein
VVLELEGISYCESNGPCSCGKWKIIRILGNLILWVLKMALPLFYFTMILSHFLNLQKQCKYYRCLRKADKTIVKFLRMITISLNVSYPTDYWKWFAKGGFLSSLVMRWELLKKLPWSKPHERWVERLFYIMLL